MEELNLEGAYTAEHLKWVKCLINKRSYENYSLNDILNFFPNGKINIADFNLITIGYNEKKERIYKIFRIISCKGPLFIGGHEVLPVNSNTSLYFSSLRTMKRTYFKMTDMTSFERSTFVILPSLQKLVRIKNIRFLIETPCVKQQKQNISTLQKQIDQMIFHESMFSPKMTIDQTLKKVKKEICEVIDRQINYYQILNQPIDSLLGIDVSTLG